jgi:hypothetical protein
MMNTADREYAWQHAADWAQGNRPHGGEFTDDAVAYAGWYYREYVIGAEDMADLPSHSLVWGRYLDSRPVLTCPNCGSHDLTPPHWNGYVLDATECRDCDTRMGAEAATPSTEVHEYIKANRERQPA